MKVPLTAPASFPFLFSATTSNPPLLTFTDFRLDAQNSYLFIYNTFTIKKCGAGGGWKRSVGQIM